MNLRERLINPNLEKEEQAHRARILRDIFRVLALGGATTALFIAFPYMLGGDFSEAVKTPGYQSMAEITKNVALPTGAIILPMEIAERFHNLRRDLLPHLRRKIQYEIW